VKDKNNGKRVMPEIDFEKTIQGLAKSVEQTTETAEKVTKITEQAAESMSNLTKSTENVIWKNSELIATLGLLFNKIKTVLEPIFLLHVSWERSIYVLQRYNTALRDVMIYTGFTEENYSKLSSTFKEISDRQRIQVTTLAQIYEGFYKLHLLMPSAYRDFEEYAVRLRQFGMSEEEIIQISNRMLQLQRQFPLAIQAIQTGDIRAAYRELRAVGVESFEAMEMIQTMRAAIGQIKLPERRVLEELGRPKELEALQKTLEETKLIFGDFNKFMREQVLPRAPGRETRGRARLVAKETLVRIMELVVSGLVISEGARFFKRIFTPRSKTKRTSKISGTSKETEVGTLLKSFGGQEAIPVYIVGGRLGTGLRIGDLISGRKPTKISERFWKSVKTTAGGRIIIPSTVEDALAQSSTSTEEAARAITRGIVSQILRRIGTFGGLVPLSIGSISLATIIGTAVAARAHRDIDREIEKAEEGYKGKELPKVRWYILPIARRRLREANTIYERTLEMAKQKGYDINKILGEQKEKQKSISEEIQIQGARYDNLRYQISHVSRAISELRSNLEIVPKAEDIFGYLSEANRYYDILIERINKQIDTARQALSVADTPEKAAEAYSTLLSSIIQKMDIQFQMNTREYNLEMKRLDLYNQQLSTASKLAESFQLSIQTRMELLKQELMLGQVRLEQQRKIAEEMAKSYGPNSIQAIEAQTKLIQIQADLYEKMVYARRAWLEGFAARFISGTTRTTALPSFVAESEVRGSAWYEGAVLGTQLGRPTKTWEAMMYEALGTPVLQRTFAEAFTGGVLRGIETQYSEIGRGLTVGIKKAATQYENVGKNVAANIKIDTSEGVKRASTQYESVGKGIVIGANEVSTQYRNIKEDIPKEVKKVVVQHEEINKELLEGTREISSKYRGIKNDLLTNLAIATIQYEGLKKDLIDEKLSKKGLPVEIGKITKQQEDTYKELLNELSETISQYKRLGRKGLPIEVGKITKQQEDTYKELLNELSETISQYKRLGRKGLPIEVGKITKQQEDTYKELLNELLETAAQYKRLGRRGLPVEIGKIAKQQEDTYKELLNELSETISQYKRLGRKGLPVEIGKITKQQEDTYKELLNELSETISQYKRLGRKGLPVEVGKITKQQEDAYKELLNELLETTAQYKRLGRKGLPVEIGKITKQQEDTYKELLNELLETAAQYKRLGRRGLPVEIGKIAKQQEDTYKELLNELSETISQYKRLGRKGLPVEIGKITKQQEDTYKELLNELSETISQYKRLGRKGLPVEVGKITKQQEDAYKELLNELLETTAQYKRLGRKGISDELKEVVTQHEVVKKDWLEDLNGINIQYRRGGKDWLEGLRKAIVQYNDIGKDLLEESKNTTIRYRKSERNSLIGVKQPTTRYRTVGKDLSKSANDAIDRYKDIRKDLSEELIRAVIQYSNVKEDLSGEARGIAIQYSNMRKYLSERLKETDVRHGDIRRDLLEVVRETIMQHKNIEKDLLDGLVRGTIQYSNIRKDLSEGLRGTIVQYDDVRKDLLEKLKSTDIQYSDIRKDLLGELKKAATRHEDVRMELSEGLKGATIQHSDIEKNLLEGLKGATIQIFLGSESLTEAKAAVIKIIKGAMKSETR